MRTLTTLTGIILATGLLAQRNETVPPVRTAEGKHYLVDQRGSPFLIHGDTAWSLISGLTNEEAEEYLENRRRKGINSIIVNLIEHKFHGPVDRYGDGPFTTPGDFAAPNEKYFAHADWVIRRAGQKGIQVFLAPIYLGYIGLDEGWIQETLANGAAKCREYGRYLGRRYAGFDNIVWIMGGDRNPDTALADVNAVAAGIKEFDTHHIFTAHCHPENSAIAQYGKTGWLDLNSTYTYEIVHKKLLDDYHRRMPFFLIESTYEGEHNASPVQIRRQAYWAILCGGAGQFMGNRPIWGFDPGWRKAMDAAASEDMMRLKQFFAARPWHDLVPDDKHEYVIEGLGEFNGLDYLAAAVTPDARQLVAYMPSRRTVSVAMAKMAGPSVRASWWNPRTGKTDPAGEFGASGTRQFTPASEGDWILVLDTAPAK